MQYKVLVKGEIMTLRPYQQECIDIIESQPPGSYLVQMATGLGKSMTFSHIPRHGRVLLLSHREELVHQPAGYYDCPVGFERAEEHSNGEEVVSASVQTLIRRLDRFRPDEFDTVIVDEAHHTVAASYRKILDYFQPRMVLGFTATANRADNVGLDAVYSDIIFQRDLRWGIQNGYLSDIECRRVEIGYDLSRVHTRLGDYAPGELADAMDGTADAIAEAYRRLARGATLIFAVNVRQCQEIAARIPGAVVVTGKTKGRADIIQAFTDGKIPCIVNCMVFTEGTDIPRVETVIIARPTQSESLYCLDEKTEVLTAGGWKANVAVGEMVAAFDTETEEIRFAPATATVRRKLRPDEFFCSISGPSEDIRVTNRHRMVYKPRKKEGWRIRDAQDIAALKDGVKIPVSGHTLFPGVPLTDDELMFIGWVMTDGSINKYNNAICISQGEHQPYLEEISNCIRGCGFKFTRKTIKRRNTQFNETSDNVIWTISKGKPRGRDKDLTGWGRLEPWLSKDMSPALFDMTERQFDVMLTAIYHGDGNKHKPKDWTMRSYHISKGNRTFIERLQIMAIQRGYRASVAVTHPKPGEIRKKDLFTIHLKKQGFVCIGSHSDRRPHWKLEPHTNETCWCVQNEIGTLVTRRNGKVAIVGNCQMTGRGLRLYPGKEKLLLVDCVGVTGKASLCTAPSLLGIDMDCIPERRRSELQGMLFDLPVKAAATMDSPESWIRNIEFVDLWARETSCNTHNINFFRMPDGSMTVTLKGRKIVIPCPDALGRVNGVPVQQVIDNLYTELRERYPDQRAIWDRTIVDRWGSAPATEKQKELIRRKCRGFNVNGLTKGQASRILNRVLK